MIRHSLGVNGIRTRATLARTTLARSFSGATSAPAPRPQAPFTYSTNPGEPI
jgi:hypothetical protein